MCHAPLVEEVKAFPGSRPIACLERRWLQNFQEVARRCGFGKSLLKGGGSCDGNMALQIKGSSAKAHGEFMGDCWRLLTTFFLG